MAASHGSKAKLYVAGYDLSAFMREATFSGEFDVADTSVWGLDSKTYMVGKETATFGGSGIYDADMSGVPNRPDDLLGTILGDVGVMTYCPAGDVLGGKARIVDAIESSYEITSPGDDVTSFKFEAQSNAGLGGAGVVLRPVAGSLAITAAGNGSNVDDEPLVTPVATTAGAVAALHVVNKGGGAGNLTVTVQSSVNGSTGWADVGAFAAVSAFPAKQVIYIAKGVTINRYLRAAWTLTGGTWDIHVAFGRRWA